MQATLEGDEGLSRHRPRPPQSVSLGHARPASALTAPLLLTHTLAH